MFERVFHYVKSLCVRRAEPLCDPEAHIESLYNALGRM